MKQRLVVFAFLFIGLVGPSRAAFQFSAANSGVSSTLNAVAYDGLSTFVAVGTNSTVATATLAGNHLFWVPSSVPAANEALRTVAFGDGIFVAGGGSNNVFSSSNGITWIPKSKIVSGINVDLTGLAFNAGCFAAVTESYQAAWTNASSFASPWPIAPLTNTAVLESFRAVTPFGTNGFALCGIRGDVRISQNAGQSWNMNREFDFSAPDLNGIATGSNELVCVGINGTIIVSTNGGAIWFTNNPGTTATIRAVAYTAPGFIAVGVGGLILTSSDGISWITNASPTTANLNGITYAASGQLKGTAVLVGDGGTVIIGSIPHTLAITNFNNTTIVSWPSSASMFTLQTNGNLATTNWGNYGGTVGDNGTSKTVTNSPSTGNLFFRLR